MFVAFLSMWFVDAIMAGATNALFVVASQAVVAVAVYWLGKNIAERLAHAHSSKTIKTMQEDIFDSLIKTKMSDFVRSNSAKYISILNNDVVFIQSSYINTMVNMIINVITVLIALVAMFMLSPINALVAFTIGFAPMIAPWIYGKKLSTVSLATSTQTIYFNERLKDFLTGFEVIKLFGAEKNIRKLFLKTASRLMRVNYRNGATVTSMGALMAGLLLLSTKVGYFIAGYLALKGFITFGAVLAISGMSVHISQPVSAFSSYVGSLISTKGVRQRVSAIFTGYDSTTRNVMIESINGSIEVNDVSFSYNNTHTSETGYITQHLKNINYSFVKGGKYAIVGPSGAGKSTLLKLLAGYYDEYDGDILINNHNIREIDRQGLYKIISVLHQNVFLLDDSLRNNITMYKEYDNTIFNEVVKKACLTELVERLGLEAALGESGNTISGGERQRVSIARTLLKGSEVLYIDEATAALDNKTAKAIEETIINMKELTCIFVTHKYNQEILKKCDAILVINNGTLAEHGTFDMLYRQKGLFYSLFKINNTCFTKQNKGIQ
jgi:ATP-binding cassette subfamily C protein